MLICVCRVLKVNPDNVATPIAASLGDVTTLSLLAWIADLLYKDMDKGLYTAPILIGGHRRRRRKFDRKQCLTSLSKIIDL
jgi:hypothetical protein